MARSKQPARTAPRKSAKSAPKKEKTAPSSAGEPDAAAAMPGGTALNAFLAQAGTLTPEERLLLVEQAICLLESFYVHLPLKRAMHAVDPLQRLRLLRKRLADIGSDARFHAEMISIFTSVRDLHTNYLLPAPFNSVVAQLPFMLEECTENGRRVYIVGRVADGFEHPTFQRGAELLYWNGIPIERAVEIAADCHAGSNKAARHSRGIAGLTQRPLIISPPPDDEWVVIRYKALDGTTQNIRLDWKVEGLPPSNSGSDAPDSAATFALGLDLETEMIQQARRALFASHTETARAEIAAAADPLAAVSGTQSVMPEVLTARSVKTSHGTFGHIRIRTFGVPNNDADAFVDEFIRLIALLPQNGLIVDVRDNGGGLIYAGEQLLQVFTPRTIEPQRVQFINSMLTQRLCELHAPSQMFSDFDLSPWLLSIRRSLETGAAYSAPLPISSVEKCNAIGQRYHGPVVLITNARCYSTTDFFAAGFQDHAIGPVLGVDANTGAGGANVFQHGFLSTLFGDNDSPFKPLPNGANMRVAIRRSIRVGPQAGTEVEDLGITPDKQHAMTRNDILNGNADLMEAAGALLAEMPVRSLSVTPTPKAGGILAVNVESRNVDLVDCYLDGHPAGSQRVSQANTATFELRPGNAKTLLVQGFQNESLVASGRVAL